MKVCFLSATHPFDDTRILHKEAHALAEAGYSVSHLAPTQADTDEVREPFLVGRVTVELYPGGGRLRRLSRLFRLARRHRGDCYHCNEVESWLLGLLLKILRPSTKVVFDIHEHYPSRFAEPHIPRALRWIGPPIMRAILKTLPWFTDYVILAKRSVLADLPASYHRHDYIFNYGVMRIDVRPRERVPEAIRAQFGSGFTAAHVGGFSRARGWPQLLEALARTRHDVRALCLGKVAEGVETLMTEARRLRVDSRITIKERVPYDQMFDYLSMSDVGLMLYQPGIMNHVFAFPMKLYDYMWAGLPCIGPSFAVEAEPVMRSERCGICIDTADPRELAQALDRLAWDRQEAREMGARGRDAVRACYNWEAQAHRLVEIYNELLGPPLQSKSAAHGIGRHFH
jgi:glycosyltransferase involved in cell wall biosynthesis